MTMTLKEKLEAGIESPMACIRCKRSVVTGLYAGPFKLTQIGPRHADPDTQCLIDEVAPVTEDQLVQLTEQANEFRRAE